MTTLFFILAIAIGGIASWQIFNWMYGNKLRDNKDQLRQESTVLLERMEKVFKVVVAEGYFTEIYDHNSPKEFLWFWNTHKKALVITKAKVSIGFDFAKMKVRKDEANRKMIIEEMPSAEVLSIDTDYKFYDINQGWLNKFKNEDYTQILSESKRLMHEKALQSDLPMIANRQATMMMQQLALSMNWELDIQKLAIVPPNLIDISAQQRHLSSGETTDFEELA
jgi:Protein of unknown function (DUF4230)